jgi:hypothetical protein
LVSLSGYEELRRAVVVSDLVLRMIDIVKREA